MAIGKPVPCGPCPTSERAKRGPGGRKQLHCDLSGQTRAPSNACNAPTPKLLAAGKQIVKILAARKATNSLLALARLVADALASLGPEEK